MFWYIVVPCIVLIVIFAAVGFIARSNSQESYPSEGSPSSKGGGAKPKNKIGGAAIVFGIGFPIGVVLLVVADVVMIDWKLWQHESTSAATASATVRVIDVPVGDWTEVIDISRRPCIGIPDRKLKVRGDGRVVLYLEPTSIPNTTWKTVEYTAEDTPGKVTLTCR